VNVLHSNLMPHFWPVPLIWYKKYKIFGGWVHKKNIAEQALAYIIWPSSTAYQTCSHACTWEKYKGFVHVRTASMLLHGCTVHVRTYIRRPCRSFTHHKWRQYVRPVRSAYQPPASSTFLLQQTSHQQPASSTLLSEQISTSHQPPANRTGWSLPNFDPAPFLFFSIASSRVLLRVTLLFGVSA
jgi:hypothetical protein